MAPTIGLVANVFQEVNALPGWLETHLPFFDDVRILHAGPGGAYSDDGTIELLEKWYIPVEFCAIDEGFGVVRTRAIHMSPCDYVMILDADERFHYLHRPIYCRGESTPHSEVDAILYNYDFRNLKEKQPDWESIARLGANLHTDFDNDEICDQGTRLRKMIDSYSKPDVIVTVRRHWHDFSFKRPTQNWFTDPDWQMRIVRNDPSIMFDPNQRMHERLCGCQSVVHGDTVHGPFMDHYHFTFKRMEMEQRSHDVDTYDRIHRGDKPLSKEEFSK